MKPNLFNEIQTDSKRFAKDFGLLWQALKKFNDDNGFFLSSGIAFNILITLFPFILLLLALVGTYLYNDQEVLNHIRAYFRDVAPTVDPKITGNLMDLIQNRRIVGILGFVGLLWTSTWVFSSFRIALNIVFRAKKSRGMMRGIVVDLLMIRPGRNPPPGEHDSQPRCHLPAGLPGTDSRGYRADDSMDPEISAPFFPHLLHVFFDLQNHTL